MAAMKLASDLAVFFNYTFF